MARHLNGAAYLPALLLSTLAACGSGSPVAVQAPTDPVPPVTLYFDGIATSFTLNDFAVALALIINAEADVMQIQQIAADLFDLDLTPEQITGANENPLDAFDLNQDGSLGDIQDLGVALGVLLGQTTFAGINALCEDLLGQSCDVTADTPLPITGATPFPEPTISVDPLTPIFAIQGSAHTSPMLGTTLSTLGIVTALDNNGFYLQDPDGDNDIATSDALFVFTDDAPTVAVGDSIRVTGEVSEFTPGGTESRNLSTTQLTNTSNIIVFSSGNPLPDPVLIVGILPPNVANARVIPNQMIDSGSLGANFDPINDGIDFFESLEGMRVTVVDAVAISETSRFGEIFTVASGGSGATGLGQRGNLNIAPNDFNPERIQLQFDDNVFDFAFPSVAVGARLGDVTGVVGYNFGNFEVVVTDDFSAQVMPSSLQPQTTTLQLSSPDTPVELLVATYNVLNLDPNDADGDMDVANGRFDLIGSQIVNNLNQPDIVCLQEIQDNSGSTDDGVVAADQTLTMLAQSISAAGGPSYEFIDNTFIGDNTSGGQPGANIRTAFLYNPARVRLQEGSVQTIGSQDPGAAFAGARLPLVATFNLPLIDPLTTDFPFDVATDPVTLICNHFSSKGGSAPILGVEQPFDQRQEEVNINGSLDERQAQSQAVREFVEGLGSTANVIVLGDFNEFEFISPLTNLEAAGLTNLINTLGANERYTFIFQGNSQTLDHILVSSPLQAQVEIVHLNVEFPETPQRASDHDPVLARLTLPLRSTLPAPLP